MSPNPKFRDKSWQRASRTALRYQQLYRRACRRLHREISEAKHTTRRQGLISQEVARVLGSVTPNPIRADIYLQHAATRWLDDTCQSQRSVMGYLYALRDWVQDSGRRDLSRQTSATRDEIREHVSHWEGKRTRWRHLSVLMSWYRWLTELGLLNRSPIPPKWAARRYRPPINHYQKGTRQSLNLDQARRVLDWLKDKPAAVRLSVCLCMLGGLRSHEAAAIRWEHYGKDQIGPILAVEGKGGRVRLLRVDPALAAVLDEHRKSAGLIAGCTTPRTIQRRAKDALCAVGLEHLSSHDLRRTFATLLRQAGADLDQIQRQLGHANPRTTQQIYVTDAPVLTATMGLHAQCA